MEVIVQQVAALCALGRSAKQISEELNITVREVKRISEMPTCKEVVRKIGMEAMEGAKSAIKSRTAGLVDAIMSNLETNLKKNNLNAVPIAINILGFTKEDVMQGDTTIQIVMPGQDVPKTITPDYREVITDVTIQGTPPGNGSGGATGEEP